jgi:hypothetical protein
MSYSFKSKDEPATDIFFLNEDNKICHASVIMEGAGGSKMQDLSECCMRLKKILISIK